jgi:tetratricopeptide (TPR) repeat protein
MKSWDASGKMAEKFIIGASSLSRIRQSRLFASVAAAALFIAIVGHAEQPVGLVLEASEGAVYRPGLETPIDAAPGVELFAGDKIVTAKSGIVFAYCPSTEVQSLAPKHDYSLSSTPAGTLPSFLTSRQAPICELPAMSRMRPAPLTPRPAVIAEGTFESRAANLSEPKLSAFQAQWRILDQASTQWDLLTSTSRVAVLEDAGLAADSVVECDRIAVRWPAATWTREVSIRIAREEAGARGIRVEPIGGKIVPKGKTYALLIGISKYRPDSGVPWLNYADKDAETFADYLQTPRGGRLRLCPEHRTDDCEIRLVENEQATLARVSSELETFVSRDDHANSDNTLILFVAAHGADPAMEKDWQRNAGIRKEPIVLTWDSDYNETKVSGYLMSELRELIARQALRYGRVLVFVDVCRAGNIGSIAGSAELQPAVHEVFDLHKGNLGMFMASQRGDDAFESSKFGGGHGAFTYFVLHGLNVDKPGEQQLMFFDLLEHIRQGVSQVTLKAQLPVGHAVDERMTVAENLGERPMQLAPAVPVDKKTLRRPRGLLPSAPKTRSSAPGAQPSDDFDRALARQHLRRDEAENAFSVLDRVRADPSSSHALIASLEEQLRIALEDRGQQAILQYLRGEQSPPAPEKFDDAEKDFRAALELGPVAPFNEARMLFCRGRALLFRHKYDDALAALRASTRLDPSRAYAYNAIGIAYLEHAASDTSLLGKAESAFHDAIRYAPYWPYPWHNLALTAIEMGRFESAIDNYRHAMEIAPDYPYLPYNLGLLYQRLNRNADAQRYYEQALKTAEQGRTSGVLFHVDGRRPEDALIHNALGTLAATRPNERAAEKEYRHALADDPLNKSVRYNLAVLLTSDDKVSAEAEALWCRNLDVDPHHLTTRLAYARYLAATARLSEAIQQFRLALNDAPDAPALRRDLAAALLATHNPNEARSVLEPALLKSGDDPALLTLMAMIASESGDQAAAAEWRRKAVRLRRRP